MKLRIGSVVVGLILCFGLGLAAQAEIRLPAVISDNMVIQQGIPAPIWGWADPGESVTVETAGRKAETKADSGGKWMLSIEPMKAGGPIDITITTKGATRTVRNVLVGEVWVCSGQSNMDFGVGGVMNAQEEIAKANYPQIRHFAVGYSAPDKPKDNCDGQWVICDPGTVGGFTAVGYFFGLNIHKELGVPVGLIKSAVGGTPVESWTGLEMMKEEPEFKTAMDLYNKTIQEYPTVEKEYKEKLALYEDAFKKPVEDKGWEAPSLDDADWKEMSLPKNWEAGGLPIDGVVWFRKELSIPEKWAGKDLLLSLGPVDDSDQTYWNGTKIGENGVWFEPRKYTIPASNVKAGKTILAVRVLDTAGNGGLWGKPEDFHLSIVGEDSEDSKISLVGSWKYKVALVIPQRPETPLGPGHAFLPTALYNGMIAPLVPYGIRGAVWYQGEGNERDLPNSYFYKFRGMINGWRKAWNEGDFPFYYVQIANFRAPTDDPAGNDGVHWATVRMSQLQTLSVKNTGMAVAVDLADPGNPFDIHPRNKQDVGYRLALWALADTYGKKDLVCSGPIYKGMKVEGNKIRLSFDYVGAGLMIGKKEGLAPTVEIKDGKLEQFSTAGSDKEWYWADARIDGDTVVVSCDKVPNPVAVRYAYSMNPEGNKLYNKNGLPASPFRTDEW